ncbi:MAG: hypothetical protein ACI4KH_05385 [Oscillospiraceae bacterium]
MKKIMQMITNKEYKNSNAPSMWGGCDVIIAEQETDEIKKWKESSAGHIAVITPNASALIWLIETLKPIAKVDYITKYDYYNTIANTANSLLSADVESLLLGVLESVESYL